MVAYNFQRRFVQKIEAGHKRQTIRGHRKRHARVGEPVQIYVGMRQKGCRKVIVDPVCTSVCNIQMLFDWQTGEAHYRLQKPDGAWPKGWLLIDDTFAVDDGFRDSRDLVTFWKAAHKMEGAPTSHRKFDGVLIRWKPTGG